MSLHVATAPKYSGESRNTYEIPEHALYLAILENAIRTIVNKPESFEAKEDLKWLHGLEVSDESIHPDEIAEILDSDIVKVLRTKFPLDYKANNRMGFISSYSMEEENLLLKMYKAGASREEFAKVFAPRKVHCVMIKARQLFYTENWSAEEDEKLISLFKAGERPYKISDALHKNVRSVVRRLSYLGVEYKSKERITNEKTKIILKVLNNELNYDEACKILGKDPKRYAVRIYRKARELGYDTTHLLKRNRRATS